MTLELLYQTHGKMVYNLALHYVQNIEDAEEITQDVFVAIHQSLPKFNATSEISTWIYRITINKSLDFIKARNRKKVAGILIENNLQGNLVKHAIVGIGLNVNQKQFSTNKATSLHAEAQITFDKDDVLQELVDALAKRYAQLQLRQFERLKSDYHQHLMGIHEICTFKTATEVFDAIVLGVDEDGRLMLRHQNRIERYQVKQISLL